MSMPLLTMKDLPRNSERQPLACAHGPSHPYRDERQRQGNEGSPEASNVTGTSKEAQHIFLNG